MTDKKDEALRMALEIVDEYVREHGYGKATLNAIREALVEQSANQVDDINVVDIPAQQCQHQWKNISSKRQIVYQCDLCGVYSFEQPAQQQEPFAWLYIDSWGDLKLSQIMPPHVGAFPVYTSPPAKPWVNPSLKEYEEIILANMTPKNLDEREAVIGALNDMVVLLEEKNK